MMNWYDVIAFALSAVAIGEVIWFGRGAWYPAYRRWRCRRDGRRAMRAVVLAAKKNGEDLFDYSDSMAFGEFTS